MIKKKKTIKKWTPKFETLNKFKKKKQYYMINSNFIVMQLFHFLGYSGLVFVSVQCDLHMDNRLGWFQ